MIDAMTEYTSPMPPSKFYLGDAVYAQLTPWGLILTTEDGISPTNEIILEPQVWAELIAYVERWQEPVKMGAK